MRAAALSLLLLCGCQALQPKATTPPTVYSLDAVRDSAAPGGTASTGLTLIVTPPHAAAGFDSPRMMYMRHTDQLEYYAHNQWIDTPARMLAPLIVAAIENSGAFRAVVNTPSPAAGEMRLDTEVLRLQQEFAGSPSQSRFSLRAYLVDSATRQVIATREFEASVPAPSEDPRGGMLAANLAVQNVLASLAIFCADTARNRR